jgi:hypothetical protein
MMEGDGINSVLVAITIFMLGVMRSAYARPLTDAQLDYLACAMEFP